MKRNVLLNPGPATTTDTVKMAQVVHQYHALYDGLTELGFKIYIPKEISSGLVVSALYPDDPNWDFTKVHDYCYERGFTIYPGKVEKMGMFRLCSLGAIDVEDITEFFEVFRKALAVYNVAVPIKYENE